MDHFIYTRLLDSLVVPAGPTQPTDGCVPRFVWRQLLGSHVVLLEPKVARLLSQHRGLAVRHTIVSACIVKEAPAAGNSTS